MSGGHGRPIPVSLTAEADILGGSRDPSRRAVHIVSPEVMGES